MIWSIGACAISLLLKFYKEKSSQQVMLLIFVFFIWLGASVSLFLDVSWGDLSSTLIPSLSFLTVWLLILCYLTMAWSLFKSRQNLTFWVTLVLFMIYGSIWSQEYFSFYTWFELGVIPILLLILFGSSSSTRLEAGLFLFFFTIVSALFLFFLLFSITMCGDTSMSSSFTNFFVETSSFFNESVLLAVCAMLAFLVKFPLFVLHVWLPKAHVEAPVMGSMILAGLLLKLGGLGFLVFKKIIILDMSSWVFLFSSFCLYSSFTVGLICFQQNDSKILVAFSSVNHMSLTIFSMLCSSSFSLIASFCILIGHGLASSLLFFLVSMPYSVSGNKGLMSQSKTFSSVNFLSIMLLGILMNLGFPPFLNFLGEILVLTHLWHFPYLALMFFLNFFVGALYSFKLLSQLIQKKKNYFSFWPFFSSSSSNVLQGLIGWGHLLPFLFFLNFALFF
uniref:NADH-ubiquinone oxidoreductase chain 4 n=1 Tax=Isodiametra pulchra TaxID=504439 RepID=A0A1X9WDA8_ISOPU|nr:NADH dehydrogenase subunit 4 [Isodiametra pulchra]ARS00910.1 NADH dehydrogenase subunit 4 [Isodiametra pulchra]